MSQNIAQQGNDPAKHNITHQGNDLLNKGYNIIPIKPKAKTPVPGLTNWTKIKADQQQVDQWTKQFPDAGVGVLAGLTPAIDIDILDLEIANKIIGKAHELLHKSGAFVTRVGQAPKTLIPCRLPDDFEPYKKRKSNVYIDIAREKVIQKKAKDALIQNGVQPTAQAIREYILLSNKNGRLLSYSNALEILGLGQQYLLFGIHPKTGLPYVLDRPMPQVSELPILTPRIIEELLDYFEELAQEMVEKKLWSLKAGGNLLGSQTSILDASAPNSTVSTSQQVRTESHTVTSSIQSSSVSESQTTTGFPGSNSVSESQTTTTQACQNQVSAPQPTTIAHASTQVPNIEPPSHSSMHSIPNMDPEVLTRKTDKRKEKRSPRRVTITEDECKKILDGIPALGHDDWLHLGMGLHYQFKGSDLGMELFKYYSKQHPGYDEQEIEDRYPTFNKEEDTVGYTFGTVRAFYNANLPKPDPIIHQTLDPQKQAFQNTKPEDLPWYYGWYYISLENKFFYPDSGLRISIEAFNTKYARELKIIGDRRKPRDFVMEEGCVNPYDIIMYMPGHMRTGVEHTGKSYVNSYQEYIPRGIKPDVYTEPKLIINLFDKVIPDQEERNTLKWFMAHVIQNPGKRVNWAPVLLGVEGTGKTTFYEIFRAVLGEKNVKSVSANSFMSDYNSYAEGSALNFIEELRVSGQNRHKAMDNMKAVITNRTIEVNPKGVNPYEVVNTASYLTCSNHPDALPINDGSRRWCVIETILALSAQDFNDIYDDLKHNAHNIKEYFMRIDIPSTFDYKGRAPVTKSTTQMVNNTQDDMADAIQAIIDKDHPLCNRSLISFSYIKEKMTSMDNIGDKKFAHTLRTKLLNMHYTHPEKKRYKIKGHEHALYTPSTGLRIKLGLPTNCFDVALDRARDSA